MNKFKLSLIASSLLMLGACGSDDKATSTAKAEAEPAKQQMKAEAAQSENERALALFEDIFMAGVKRSPIYQTYLGMPGDKDKLDDLTEEFQEESIQIAKADLKRLAELDYDALDESVQVSYKMMEQNLQEQIDDHKWRYHGYPINQMFGTHTFVPTFLMNQHRVNNVQDAKDYISRLNDVKRYMGEQVDDLNKRTEMGIIPPKFVFPHVLRASNNIITGQPFTDGDDSPVWSDIQNKVNALEISDEEKQSLIAQAKDALMKSFLPAYQNLIANLTEIEKKANTNDGAWKFPDGDEFYNNALKRTTTTDLTASEIHEIGLKEVARIHDEMKDIMKKVEFDGDLQAFFEFMRTDKQFYYPETEEGKQRYLDEATAMIDAMKARLDELFIVKPKADLVVKRVEAFREKSAGKAFYQRPAPDGSRPGMYYANLYKMSDMPTYQMEALAYHEGIPGHHMQLAIAQELEGVPKFRKFGSVTAYTEGWGLYTELLPKEIGAYEDPYSDFGRLAMELWRACRLVVDTGIHKMKWTREQAIDYLAENTPNPHGDVVKAIERYIVMPSQATAYKIGMLKILELREDAKQRLGDKFDIREFHDVVLKNGPVPLNVLTSMVDKWVKSKA